MIIIAFLLLAWIMTLFEMDVVITEGINELFNKDVTRNTYWLMMLIIGVVLEIVHNIK